jgi:hypothetical protein
MSFLSKNNAGFLAVKNMEDTQIMRIFEIYNKSRLLTGLY